MTRIRAPIAFVLFLLLTGAALLLVPSPASASLDVAGWHFRDLGDLEIPITFDLAFDQDTIAWSASSAEQADIYVVDLATGASTQLTNTPEVETSVALDGDRVVFVSHEATSDYRDPGDLWLYDLATKERRLVAHARFYLGMGTGPWIVGDHIAWVQIDPADGQTLGRPALYLYTISANATVQVADRVYVGGASSSGNTSIDLDASHLAFITTPSPQEDGEVWLYDVQMGARTNLGSTPAESLHVSLEGDLVTWVSSPAPPSPHLSPYASLDIFLHRISTGKTEKIATREAPEAFPKTDGRFVVWDTYEGGPAYETTLRKIKAYDSQTGQIIDVSQNQFLNFTPEIADGIVAWERGGELESEIMAHDLLTGQTTQLSSNRTWMDQLALVNDRTVVWWKHWFSMETGVPEPPDSFMVATAPSSFVDPFADVPGQHRFRTAILGMNELGIATGYPYRSPAGEGRVFRPDEPLLRAQFAKMICEAFDLPVTEGLTAPFSDLGVDDEENLYPHEYVAALAARGIVQGKTPDRFDPYGPLTRGQAVSMLVRALDTIYPGLVTEAQAEAPGAYFWDPPHRTSLRRAYANDLLSSVIDWMQRWGAYDSCTRGEAAQMIWNALSLLEQEGRG